MSIENARMAELRAQALEELGIKEESLGNDLGNDEVPSEEVVANLETTEAQEVQNPEQAQEEVKPAHTALELEQMERGWDPNHPDGVSAKEFKRVGEIIEAKRRASKEAQLKSKEVEELTLTVKQLVEHNKAMVKAQIEQKKRELTLQKMEKIREGDVDAVLSLEQEQAALAQEEVKPQPAAQTPISEDVKAFQEKYKEYLTGTTTEAKRIQSIVKSQVEFFMDTDPNIDEKVAIREIEDILAKTFPDKFESSSKAKSAAKVSVSTTTRAVGSNALVSNMTTEDKILYESIKAVDANFSVNDFANMYLKNRK